MDITPEPSAEERAAIELVIAALAANGKGDRGEWWRRGLCVETLPDLDEPSHSTYRPH